ncbi:hypothetical protein D3C73_1525440 [compost metagenome]
MNAGAVKILVLILPPVESTWATTCSSGNGSRTPKFQVLSMNRPWCFSYGPLNSTPPSSMPRPLTPKFFSLSSPVT